MGDTQRRKTLHKTQNAVQNGKFLGTDASTAGASIFPTKSGTDSGTTGSCPRMQNRNRRPTSMPTSSTRPPNVSSSKAGACRYAGGPICAENGATTKSTKIIDWLVSPEGLNFNIFRYNIGGGDDPENNNCTAHHMGSGQGFARRNGRFQGLLRRTLHLDPRCRQRKIMLKIKEKRPDAIFEAFSNSCPYYA